MCGTTPAAATRPDGDLDAVCPALSCMQSTQCLATWVVVTLVDEVG